MSEWVGFALDAVLISVVGLGVVQATRLIAQLRDLRSSRAEMDRFVRDFNGAVMRAEAGIKALRAAARESGDDLEKLVEKATMVRDELNFIVESADNVAERLSVSASSALHGDHAPSSPKAQAAAASENKSAASQDSSQSTKHAAPAKTEAPPASRAEKELLQALQKLK